MSNCVDHFIAMPHSKSFCPKLGKVQGAYCFYLVLSVHLSVKHALSSTIKTTVLKPGKLIEDFEWINSAFFSFFCPLLISSKLT